MATATITQRESNTLAGIVDRGGPVRVAVFGVPGILSLALPHVSPDTARSGPCGEWGDQLGLLVALLTHSALLALDVESLVKLLVISLVAGVGISAVGPGGVFMTIGLYALTTLTPAQVAGTAIVTHIGTGLVGTAAYLRSGQFRHRATRRIAVILCVTAFIGIPVGMWINARVSRQEFGLLLGLWAAAIGVLVWYRQRRRAGNAPSAEAEAAPPTLTAKAAALIGLCVAAAASLFGIGGPMLCVPLLVASGVPMLPALAAAQAQSVVGSGLGAVGYAVQGAVDWPMAVFIAVPQMLGVVVGWKIAHAVPARSLAMVLALALIGLAPYLALGGG